MTAVATRFRRSKLAVPGVAPLEDVVTKARDSDPRRATTHMPIAQPRPGEFYPTEGIPYPNPDDPPELSVPVIATLDPAIVTVGDPDFTIRVIGENFKRGDVILWNGLPEPTTVVSGTEVTTGVTMSLVTVGSTVTVAVRNLLGATSNVVNFIIQDAPAAL